jgi:hypothetical protein
MNADERIPRSRGAVCGSLLILLGLWGGLAPFVGPYFHFGFTPDKAWHYDSGRLYYSIIPGAAALLGGALIVSTRSRLLGAVGGALGVLGGAWFIVGTGFVNNLLYRRISVGTPIVAPGASVSVRLLYAETMSLFIGLGVLIVLAGAVAVGRFSMVAATDVAEADDSYQAEYSLAPAATTPDLSKYPTTVTSSSGVAPFEPAPFPDTAQLPKSE